LVAADRSKNGFSHFLRGFHSKAQPEIRFDTDERNCEQSLCRNRIVPLTVLHRGLSATRDWSETAINNSPSAAAFSFTKLKLRFLARPVSRMMNKVAPRGSAQLVFIPLILTLPLRIGESFPANATDAIRNNPAKPNRRAPAGKAAGIEENRMTYRDESLNRASPPQWEDALPTYRFLGRIPRTFRMRFSLPSPRMARKTAPQ
jgi:hypothetical protein